MNLRVIVPLMWLLLLVGTLILTVLASRHDTLPGDTAIMAWAQDQPLPGERLSELARVVTGTEVVLTTGALAVALLWFAGLRWEAGFLALGLLMLPMLQAGVKEVVARPRPSELMVDVRATFSSPSFPAGHVMSPTLLYGFLIWISLTRPRVEAARPFIFTCSSLIIALTVVANIWMGVHWPSDVVGGWVWALTLLVPLLYGLEVFSCHRRDAGS